MADDAQQQDTLVIIKPDSFWRGLDHQVEARLNALGLNVVAERKLANAENLPVEKWKEFYFPAIGNRPPCLEGTAKYMAHGPVKVIHLRGPGAIQRVRRAVGATRPWQAEQGTIRGDFWPGANESNALFRLKFQQPGDDQFLFNMIHASDSEQGFAREIGFFGKLNGASRKTNRVPDGYHSITPYLKLPNAERLVDFLKQAFDGIEKGRLLRPDGTLLHAEVLIGDSIVMVHEAPGHWKPKPSTLYLHVADVDATYKRAIEAGGVSVWEPAKMYYGARVACVTDVSENDWWIATLIEVVPVEEIQERATAFLKARTEQASH